VGPLNVVSGTLDGKRLRAVGCEWQLRADCLTRSNLTNVARAIALPVLSKSMQTFGFHRQIIPVSAPPNRTSAARTVDSLNENSKVEPATGYGPRSGRMACHVLPPTEGSFLE